MVPISWLSPKRTLTPGTFRAWASPKTMKCGFSLITKVPLMSQVTMIGALEFWLGDGEFTDRAPLIVPKP